MNDLSPTNPVARARDLAHSIAASADTIERRRRITEPLLGQLHEARLFRMLYPRSVGGDEVEPATYIDAVGELARHDGSVGWCVSIANSIGLFAPYLDPEAARTVFGDRRATCARRLPGHRALGFRQRLPPCQLDGGARHGRRARRLAAPQQFRPADIADLAVPGRTGDIARQLGPDRA